MTRDTNVDDAQLFSATAQIPNADLTEQNTPPVIVSPPPLPHRQPNFESCWDRPQRSPRSSPLHSPQSSPFHSPSGSPTNTRRRAPSPAVDDGAVPPRIPQPYKGNSSLLREHAVKANSSELLSEGIHSRCGLNNADTNNVGFIPPIPARQRDSAPALPERHPFMGRSLSPVPDRFQPVRKDGSLKMKRTPMNIDPECNSSLKRRTRSDENLDRSYDIEDFEEVGEFFKRSCSMSQRKNANENTKLYEPIFNADPFLFPKNPHEPSSSAHAIPPEQEEKPIFQNFSRSDSVRKLDPGRPVPLPPSVESEHPSVGNVLERPDTLSLDFAVLKSDNDPPTPVLPPKKNRQGKSLTSMENEGTDKKELSPESLLAVNLKVNQGNVSPFNDEFNADVAFGFVTTNDDESQNRKGNEVYYPLPNNMAALSEVLPESEDFYDSNDDNAMQNYDSPVPIIHSPVDSNAPSRSVHSSSSADTPLSDHAADPFSDPFFTTSTDEAGNAPPPIPPHGRNMPTAGVHRRGMSPATSVDNIPESESRVNSAVDPLTGEVIVAGPGRFFDGRQTRNDASNPMQYYDEDFQILMAQGYSREAIKKALTVANNNFSIARNILKEFTPISK